MKLFLSILVLTAFFAPVYGAQVELLENPGFEDGVLTPWATDTWIIETTDPHTGVYCAFADGNHWIEQAFDPTDVNDISSFTLWMRQPESVISAVYMYYGASDYDSVLNFLTTADWTEFDHTGDLRSSGNLEKIKIWGYSGGGSDPDHTYLDDVSIIYEDYVGIENASLGSIKATFK